MDFSTLKFLGLPLLAWIPLLPLLGALINLVIGRWLSRGTIHTIAVAAVAAACGLSLYLVFYQMFLRNGAGPDAPRVWETGGISQTVYTWLEIGSFKADLAFRLDTLSAVMILIVTFVGML